MSASKDRRCSIDSDSKEAGIIHVPVHGHGHGHGHGRILISESTSCGSSGAAPPRRTRRSSKDKKDKKDKKDRKDKKDKRKRHDSDTSDADNDGSVRSTRPKTQDIAASADIGLNRTYIPLPVSSSSSSTSVVAAAAPLSLSQSTLANIGIFGSSFVLSKDTSITAESDGSRNQSGGGVGGGGGGGVSAGLDNADRSKTGTTKTDFFKNLLASEKSKPQIGTLHTKKAAANATSSSGHNPREWICEKCKKSNQKYAIQCEKCHAIPLKKNFTNST